MPWEQLQAILQENSTNKGVEDREPPTACPIDGAILVVHPSGGKRNCAMGNYTWSGGTTT